jgi:DNA-nicking Smr family endonuclease
MAAVADWMERPSEATFDLHGMTVLEAATRAEQFLRVQARVRPGGVVRLITGRGRGGKGAPIRTRIRTLLTSYRKDGRLVADYALEHSEGSFLVRLR